MSDDRIIIFSSIACLLATILIGPVLAYAIIFQPASKMVTPDPAYDGLTKDSILIMSNSKEVIRDHLIRYVDEEDKIWISRAVGKPGDKISVVGGALVVNGVTYRNYPGLLDSSSTLDVPPEHIFAIADRFESSSQRKIQLSSALIPEETITGVVLKVLHADKVFDEHLIETILGIGFCLLTYFLMQTIKRNENIILKPISSLSTLLLTLNLLGFFVLSISAMFGGYWAFMSAIYYFFVSWLTLLGVSISNSHFFVLLMTLLGLLTGVTDILVLLKRQMRK